LPSFQLMYCDKQLTGVSFPRYPCCTSCVRSIGTTLAMRKSLAFPLMPT
jgi:hypothetical protein